MGAMMGFVRRHWPEEMAARPGDRYVQLAVILTALPACLFVLCVVYMTLVGKLGLHSSWLIVLASFVASAGIGSLFGHRRSLATNIAIAAGIVVVATLACNVIVDTSYDGEDYHYTAIWALANGWNPFHFGRFADFAAPGSNVEPWAMHYPKADWLVMAVTYAAGVSSEGAKSAGVILIAATWMASFGLLQQLGRRGFQAAVLATVVAANPISLSQLFMRMCDGRLGSLAALFMIFLTLAIITKHKRYLIPAFLAMVFAMNTKFSMIPMFLIMGLGGASAYAIFNGARAGARATGLLLALTLFSVFIVGWDPYLRNTLGHGRHPFYPIMGRDKIDTMWDSRPVSLLPHSGPVRLAMTVFSRTGYDGPQYKLPFTVNAEEWAIAGDPEPRFGGYGPLFSGALLLSLIGGASLVRRQHLPVLCGIGAVAVSVLLMPEGWLARYVPQFWLVPAGLAVAATLQQRRFGQIAGWAAVVVLLADGALVSASAAQLQGSSSIEIARQIAHYRNAGQLCANVEASPARWALLSDAGLSVRLIEGPPPKSCQDVQEMSAAHREDGNGLGYLCRCP